MLPETRRRPAPGCWALAASGTPSPTAARPVPSALRRRRRERGRSLVESGVSMAPLLLPVREALRLETAAAIAGGHVRVVAGPLPARAGDWGGGPAPPPPPRPPRHPPRVPPPRAPAAKRRLPPP